MTHVPFANFGQTDLGLVAQCREAITRVIDESDFILGAQVAAFETDFAAYVGVKYCIGVNNGTTALHLALLASGVGPGHEVITTPLTWISTAWAITYCGATPVFVDIEPGTYTIDPDRVAAAITPRTKAILPVHLYGQVADIEALRHLASARRLILIEDAAQAHGAGHLGGRVGTFGEAGCFSFYPSKNLGAFGEGGCVVTNDSDIAARVRRLRDHAQTDRHCHVEIGYNARMEGLQGAVLRTKLPFLDGWNATRAAIARRYLEGLAHVPGLELPTYAQQRNHVWHLFVVLIPRRDEVRDRLVQQGIETRIHYPTLVPYQPAYASLNYQHGVFPVAESVASRCLSLPMYPELTDDQIEYTIEQVRRVLQ